MALYDDDNLPHLCDIYKTTRVREAGVGNAKKTPQRIAEGVKCWEQAASASETKEYMQRGQRVSRKVYFNYDVRSTITPRCQIVITHRQNGDGIQEEVSDATREIYDVVSVDEPDSSAGYGFLWKVMLTNTSSDRNPI